MKPRARDQRQRWRLSELGMLFLLIGPLQGLRRELARRRRETIQPLSAASRTLGEFLRQFSLAFPQCLGQPPKRPDEVPRPSELPRRLRGATQRLPAFLLLGLATLQTRYSPRIDRSVRCRTCRWRFRSVRYRTVCRGTDGRPLDHETSATAQGEFLPTS